jgi:antitoxin component YwqK of YwqJK toxin-antitoxin module
MKKRGLTLPIIILSIQSVSAQDLLQLSSEPTSTLASAVSEDAETASVGQERELIQERYPDGKVKVERWIVELGNGDIVNDGSYVVYDSQGKVVESGEYAKNQRIGAWSKMLDASQVRELTVALDSGFRPPFESKAEFKSGQLHGDWICADASGKLVFAWSFRDGRRNGQSIWFDSQGETIQSIPYKDNLAHGPAVLYTNRSGDDPGVQFQNGLRQVVVAEYYPGRIPSERSLRLQQSFLRPADVNLVGHDWRGNSVIYRQYESAERVLHGKAVTYYPNGKRESEGNYDQGKRSGMFTWWYANGQKKSFGRYLNDQEHGDWVWYHENGSRQARGSYANGIKQGEWSTWHASGKLASRKNIERGLKVRSVSQAKQR